MYTYYINLFRFQPVEVYAYTRTRAYMHEQSTTVRRVMPEMRTQADYPVI